MLNVPDSIKALLKQDGVLKNFRVSFPNGDHADICNDQIIRESMRFEETLCSHSPLKFGVCEANILSFKCYGVDNIKRKIIHVRMELDISSLSAAEQAQYGQTSDDVPFVFYPISYGNFTVQSCERDADINLRKIVAASTSLMSNDDFTVTMDGACEYDKRKLFYYTYSTSKTASFNETLYAVLQGQDIFDREYIGHDTVIDISVQSANHDIIFADPYAQVYDIKSYNRGMRKLSFYVDIKAISYLMGNTITVPYQVNQLNRLETPDGYVERAEEFAQDLLDTIAEIGDLNTLRRMDAQVFKSDGLSDLKKLLYGSLLSCLLAQYWWADDNKHNPEYTSFSDETWFDENPYVPMNQYFMASNENLFIPKSVEIWIKDVTDVSSVTDVFHETFNAGNDPYKYYRFSYMSTDFIKHAFIDITTEEVKIGAVTRYSPAMPISDIDPKIYLQDQLELMGLFGGLGRDGLFRTYNVSIGDLFPANDLYPADDLYPESEEDDINVSRSEYISCLYDEDAFYFKGLYVPYKDTNDDPAEYRVLFDETDNPDMEYYDLSGNQIISENTYTEEQIISLTQGLAEALQNMVYSTVDVEMRALPYIEIGDIVYIHAPEKTMAFPVLSNTIIGIQDLRANLTSR